MRGLSRSVSAQLKSATWATGKKNALAVSPTSTPKSPVLGRKKKPTSRLERKLEPALQSPSHHERKVAALLLKTDCADDWRWEFWFHPVRKFRFDFAIPKQKLAIEIHGGAWSRGRHARPLGMIADAEKARIAIAHGWRVLPYIPHAGDKWLDDMIVDLGCANIHLT